MENLIIPQGKVWAVRQGTILPTPLARTLTYFGPTFQRGYMYSVRLPALDRGVGFKLCGLSYPFPVTFSRVHRYGWDEFGSISHENSDRIVIKSLGDGKFAVNRYSYRDAMGGIGGGKDKEEFEENRGPLSARLGVVEAYELFGISLLVKDLYATFTLTAPSLDTNKIAKVPFLTPPCRPFLKEFAHADNGANQPVAPVDITFQFGFDNV